MSVIERKEEREGNMKKEREIGRKRDKWEERERNRKKEREIGRKREK